MTRSLRQLMPIVIALALGPLIAGLAVWVFSLANELFVQSGPPTASELLPMLPVYLAFAYVIGWPIALLAGLLVSVWMIWRQPNVLVAIGAAVLATAGFMGVGATGFLGPVEYTNARSNFPFTLVLAVIAAAGCWLLTRRFAKVSTGAS